jgi:hypothetical protein
VFASADEWQNQSENWGDDNDVSAARPISIEQFIAQTG